MSRNQYLVFALSAVLISTLACNASINTRLEPTEMRSLFTQTPAEIPSLQSPTVTLGDLVDCPQAVEGTQTYINQETGFCFLYPDALTQHEDISTSDSIWLYGPPFPPDSMEPASVGLVVTYAGPAVYVSNSAEYASRWADIFLEEVPEKPQPEPISVNGQQAVMMRDLPGWLNNRTAFVVVNGHQYKISLSPEIGMVSELDPLAQETWDTVTSSIVFFEPTLVKEVIKSEDVCPQAAADTQIKVDLANGFCFLAPADATPHPLFMSNGFQIGPTDTHPEFSEVQASLVIGSHGPASGVTNPRDAVPGLLQSGVELSAIQDIIIDEKPAITYLNTNPPWVHRLAVIVANDTVYTISMNPYDEQQYPAMIPDANRLWDTAIGSLVFFTPFE